MKNDIVTIDEVSVNIPQKNLGPPSLSELILIIFHIELTHLDSEDFILHRKILFNKSNL